MRGVENDRMKAMEDMYRGYKEDHSLQIAPKSRGRSHLYARCAIPKS